MQDIQTHILAIPGVDLVYDVRGPLPPTGAHRALLMIGQPMAAEGFTALAPHFTDRTVLTYDPRGLGRSVRTDGRPTTRRSSRPPTCTHSFRRSRSVRSTCSPAAAAR